MSVKVQVVPLSEVPAGHYNHSSRPLLLVVDDDPVVADTLALILSCAGYSTMKAYAPQQALEMVHRNPPDLLLSDIAMPGMTGVALAIAVKAMHPACRVLLISGHATTRDLIEARSAGYDFTLLEKPVHPTVVLHHVTQQLQAGMSRTPQHSVLPFPMPVAAEFA